MKMRVAASVALTVLMSAALAGCQFVTPQQTARSYTPSDGVNGSIGALQIRNVFLIAGDDDNASLIGVLANSADADSTVTLEWTGSAGTESDRVTVPAGGLVSLTTDPKPIDASVASTSESVIFDGVDPKAGALFTVTFTTTAGAKTLQLPVLNGALEEYATLVPTFTPTPTPTPTPTESATPGVTDTATPEPTETPAG